MKNKKLLFNMVSKRSSKKFALPTPWPRNTPDCRDPWKIYLTWYNIINPRPDTPQRHDEQDDKIFD